MNLFARIYRINKIVFLVENPVDPVNPVKFITYSFGKLPL